MVCIFGALLPLKILPLYQSLDTAFDHLYVGSESGANLLNGLEGGRERQARKEMKRECIRYKVASSLHTVRNVHVYTSSMSWLCLRAFLAFMTLTMAA